MAKEKKNILSEMEGDAEMDMTPMIDVVFLLIIFFMLVTEMSDNTKEKLVLPKAEKATPDSVEDPGRLVVNINTDGEIKINAITYFSPTRSENFEALDILLEAERLASFDHKEGLPQRAVIIRVDEKTEFEHVARLMKRLMKFQLWKLMFAAQGVEIVS